MKKRMSTVILGFPEWVKPCFRNFIFLGRRENEIRTPYDHTTLLFRIFLVFALLLAGIRCDNLLPSEYKAKEYSTPEIDAMACEWLSRSISDSVRVGQPIPSQCYVINSRALWDSTKNSNSLVDHATRLTHTDNQIISSKFDTLVLGLSHTPLKKDTIMAVLYDDTLQNFTYALLDSQVTAGQPKDIYIYVSMPYTRSNINEHVSIQLIKRDTSIASYDYNLSEETVASCTQTVMTDAGIKYVPTISARYRFHLDSDVYLVRFTMSNSKAMAFFFKLLIFSI